MRKIIMCILIVLLILTLVGIIMAISNPLRKSEENIRKDILELTPIGLNIEDVIKIIENNEKWGNKYEKFERGYGLISIGEPTVGFFPTVYYSEDSKKVIDIIGVKSIEVHAGSYHNIFKTDVLIYLAFDDESKLIDIAIRKNKDIL